MLLNKTKSRIDTGALFVSSIFTMGILAVPITGFAQTAQSTNNTTSGGTGSLKINTATLGKTESQCVTNVSAIKASNMSAVKSFGDKRFKKRQELLNKYVNKVEEKYKSVEKNKETKNTNTAKIAGNKRLLTWEVSKSDAKINKEPLLNEVKGTLGQIDNLKGQFNKADTPTAAAGPLCSLVYDQKVFSYFSNKITQQRRIDTLNISLKENKARLENYKKAEQKGAKSAQVLKEIEQAMSKNTELQSQVNNAQSQLNAIKKDSLPAVNEQGAAIKSADYFNKIWGAEGKKEYQTLSAQSKTHSTTVTAFNKKVKTKKPTTKKD